MVRDDKIAFQTAALDAQLRALEAQLARAEAELARGRELVERGVSTAQRLEGAQIHWLRQVKLQLSPGRT